MTYHLSSEQLFAIEENNQPKKQLEDHSGDSHGIKRSLKKQFFSWWQASLVREEITNPRDSKIPAGYAFFSIFLSHDLSWKSDKQKRWNTLTNTDARQGFQLNTLYGNSTNIFLENGKFKIGRGLNFSEKDFFRNSEGEAIIADPRNERLHPISQLTLGFQLFHNFLFDQKRSNSKKTDQELGEEIRKEVQWYYQWVLLNDFFPRIIGLDPSQIQALGQEICPFSLEEMQSILATPSFRIVLNLLRARYQINTPLKVLRKSSDQGNIPLVTPEAALKNKNLDKTLVATLPTPLLPFRSIQWDLWLSEYNSKKQQEGQFCPAIRTTLNKDLLSLCTYRQRSLTSMISDSIRKDIKSEIQSGNRIAKCFGLQPSEKIQPEAPLWQYLIHESIIECAGKHLGPLGQRLYSCFLMQTLKADPASFWNLAPDWQPVYSGKNEYLSNQSFKLIHLLAEAGMPINQNDASHQMGL